MYKSKFLKFSLLFLVVALVTSLSLFGCKEEAAPSEEEAAAPAEEVEEVTEEEAPAEEGGISGDLNVITWGEYDTESIRDAFAENYPNVNLNISYIGGAEEGFAKIKNTPGQFDVICNNNAYLIPSFEAGIIEPLDISKLSNWMTIFKPLREADFNKNENGEYLGTPQTYGIDRVVYNTDYVAEAPESYFDILENEELYGKMGTLDDFLILMSLSAIMAKPADITSQAAIQHYLYNQTPEQFEKTVEIATKWMTTFKTLSPSWGDLQDLILKEEVILSPCCMESFVEFGKQEGIPLAMTIPKEGTFGWFDYNMLVKDAPNPEAAYAYIDFMLEGKWQADVAMLNNFGVCTETALDFISKEMYNEWNYGDVENILANAIYMELPPEESDMYVTKDQWVTAYEEIKAGVGQ